VHFGDMNAGGLLMLPQRRAATRSRRRRLSLSGKTKAFVMPLKSASFEEVTHAAG
jgi:hypothetical protein